MDNVSSLIVRLRNLLRRRGRSRDESDELIQEAFLRLQVYCRDRHIAKPEAFLVRTTLNLLIDSKRNSAKGPVLERDIEALVLVDPSPRPEDVLIEQDRMRQLDAGLRTLSSTVRRAFLLHRLEGYSYGQVAEKMGLSIRTVEKHIAKASLFLFDWMAKEWRP